MELNTFNIKGIVLFLIITFSSFFNIWAQTPDYKLIFGSGWQNALQFVTDNKEWMEELCDTYKVDYKTAATIVFPELVRYSIVRDKIEITLLKALYTNKGSEYSNFSVGVFQIKPSCAETVLDKIPLLNDRELSNWFKNRHRGLKEYRLRSAIVRELENPQTEFIYVLAIIKYLDKTYRNLSWVNINEKLRFYAAAYNSGFSNSEFWIRQQMTAKTFHTGIVKPSVCYSYADVAYTFYAEYFGMK
jgi:hypothetical protein